MQTPSSITLEAASIAVEIVPAGASVRSIRIPGVGPSLVLGADDPALYGPRNRAFLGASVGRHANRIANARFAMAGREHRLSVNEAPHHLHGGTTGFWAKDWRIVECDDRRAVLALSSPDGEDGYPGAAEIVAIFTVTDDGTLSIEYRGTVDRPSILNLTSHLYFNLSGNASARDHLLRIDADAYLPVDAALIPTGEVRGVAGTGFDFRAAKRLDQGPASLDHCFCLSGGRTETPRPALGLRCPETGIAMELATTEPGVQIYDGAKFDGSLSGLDGAGIAAFGGIAIEPQGWPNGPNEAGFPSPAIAPGQTYVHHSLYRFSRG